MVSIFQNGFSSSKPSISRTGVETLPVTCSPTLQKPLLTCLRPHLFFFYKKLGTSASKDLLYFHGRFILFDVSLCGSNSCTYKT